MTQHIPDLTHFELHLNAEREQQTAIELLAENISFSKQKLKSTMSNGAVWLESAIGIHRLRRAKKILKKNDTVHFYYDENIQLSSPSPPELIADEGEYSVWNKPYGMYSQGSKWSDHCTINRWAETHLIPERPAFIVHRLDRAANGLILITHSKKTSKAFSELFKNREIEKYYSAIVEGTPKELTLPYIISSHIDDKLAITKILSIEDCTADTNQNSSCKLIIEIETGRKHQIRKHLSELGHPVIGDRLYGSKQLSENLQLQARVLKFICPITKNKREYSLS